MWGLEHVEVHTAVRACCVLVRSFGGKLCNNGKLVLALRGQSVCIYRLLSKLSLNGNV